MARMTGIEAEMFKNREDAIEAIAAGLWSHPSGDENATWEGGGMPPTWEDLKDPEYKAGRFYRDDYLERAGAVLDVLAELGIPVLLAH